MATSPNKSKEEKPSLIHGLFSAFVPGLGQMIAGQWSRGIGILVSVAVLGFLSIWTIAQRARFPDYRVSAQIFSRLFLQTAALLLFLIALRYVLKRFVIKDVTGQAITQAGLYIFYALALFLITDSLLATAGSEADLSQVYGTTGVLAAGALTAFWFWQLVDASRIGAGEKTPPFLPGIVIACVLIFVLGWNITEIDLPKAVREYKDTQIILRKIVWPWQSAFEYQQQTVESSAKIQAPCPEGAEGPPANQPDENEAYIIATPTCGQLTDRDLRGNITLGTELTITGGNFEPGSTVQILWKNPIGNPFTPRGVGDTTITVGADGGFVTKLNIPSAVVPETAVGAQIHTLIVRQESGLVFTGHLSHEMNLALVGMLETIMLGLMATFFGIVLAVPVSFLAARNLMAPIVTTLSGVAGGLLVMILAIWLAFIGTNQISSQIGGLQGAPLATAATAIVLVAGLGVTGWRAGSWGMQTLGERTPDSISRAITALIFGFLGALLGYGLGIGFSRGILSIPWGAETAAQFETRSAIAGAILVGVLTFVYAYRKGVMGEISIGIVIYAIVRTFMNIIRSIEPLIWALVGIIWIGPGPFAGTIALTVHTVAALGKLYSEAIESIDSGPIEAIQATGANRLQTIIYAVVPQVLPPFISFTIYRWDINVRLSTVIGLVGGGGIGFILIQWIRQFQYEPAGMAVWLITITVAALDYVSSEIRERFV